MQQIKEGMLNTFKPNIDSFSNKMLENEVIVNGVILRIYNKLSPQSIGQSNERFLKALFSRSRDLFNDFTVLKTFIKIQSEEKAEDEEEKVSNEGEQSSNENEYNHFKLISQSDFADLDPEKLVEYQLKSEKSCFELTVILSSALINIRNNLNLTEEFTEKNTEKYSKQLLEEVLHDEVDLGLLNILDINTCIKVRFTLLQILTLVPAVNRIAPCINLLKSMKEKEQFETIEIQLILSVILKTLIEAEDGYDQLQVEDMDIIIEISTSCELSTRILELILNYAQRQGSFGVKINELRNRDTNINWEIVDDTRDSQMGPEPSFGFSKYHR